MCFKHEAKVKPMVKHHANIFKQILIIHNNVWKSSTGMKNAERFSTQTYNMYAMEENLKSKTLARQAICFLHITNCLPALFWILFADCTYKYNILHFNTIFLYNMSMQTYSNKIFSYTKMSGKVQRAWKMQKGFLHRLTICMRWKKT